MSNMKEKIRGEFETAFERADSDERISQLLKAEGLSYESVDGIKRFKRNLKALKAIKNTDLKRLQKLIWKKKNHKSSLNALKKAKIKFIREKEVKLRKILNSLVDNIHKLKDLKE